MKILILFFLIFSQVSFAQMRNNDVENTFRNGALNLLPQLQIKNEDGIDLVEFEKLINRVEIRAVAHQLYLGELRKDAINYFPEEELIVLDAKHWSSLFEAKAEVQSLIYHEFLPYFFGNDKNYIRARKTNFERRQNLPFDDKMNGLYDIDFAPNFAESALGLCYYKVQIDLTNQTIKLGYAHRNKIFCPYTDQFKIFHCSQNSLSNCEPENQLSILPFQLSFVGMNRFEITKSYNGSNSWTLAAQFSKVLFAEEKHPNQIWLHGMAFLEADSTILLTCAAAYKEMMAESDKFCAQKKCTELKIIKQLADNGCSYARLMSF